jgi:hypothetical protein
MVNLSRLLATRQERSRVFSEDGVLSASSPLFTNFQEPIEYTTAGEAGYSEDARDCLLDGFGVSDSVEFAAYRRTLGRKRLR